MRVLVAFTWRGGIEVNAKSLEEAISKVSDMQYHQRSRLLKLSQFEMVDCYQVDKDGQEVENQPANGEIRG